MVTCGFGPSGSGVVSERIAMPRPRAAGMYERMGIGESRRTDRLEV